MMKTSVLPAVSSLLLAMAMTVPAFAGEQYGEGQQTSHQQSGQESGMQQMQQEGVAAKQIWKAETTVEDVTGKQVVNSDGEEIGEVSKIVEDNAGNMFAVVSVGGFLGIGAKEVTVPLDRMELKDKQLMAPLASKEELDKKSAYDETKYQQLPGEQMVNINTTRSEDIGQSSAQQEASFNKLDSDNNGYLSQQEAKKDSNLSKHWSSADSNHNDKIDRAEFSAFETRSMKQSPAQMQPGGTGKSESTGNSQESGSGGSGY